MVLVDGNEFDSYFIDLFCDLWVMLGWRLGNIIGKRFVIDWLIQLNYNWYN